MGIFQGEAKAGEFLGLADLLRDVAADMHRHGGECVAILLARGIASLTSMYPSPI